MVVAIHYNFVRFQSNLSVVAPVAFLEPSIVETFRNLFINFRNRQKDHESTQDERHGATNEDLHRQ